MDDGAGYGVETEQLLAARTVVDGLAGSLPGGALVCVVPGVPVTGDEVLQEALGSFDADWSMGDTRVWGDLTRIAEAYGQAAECYERAEAEAQARIALLQAAAQASPGWVGAVSGAVSGAVAP